MKSKVRFRKLQIQIMSPVIALILVTFGLFFYVLTTFRGQVKTIQEESARAAEISDIMYRINEIQAEAKLNLLEYQFSKDEFKIVRLQSLSSQRNGLFKSLASISNLHSGRRELVNAYLNGAEVTSSLQENLLNAIRTKNFKFAEEIFASYSLLYQINNARLDDVFNSLRFDLNENQNRARRILEWLAVPLILIILQAAFFLWVTSSFYKRRILKPLEVLHRALRAVTRGNLATRVFGRHAPVEIEEMIHDFNAMTDSLESSQNELKDAKEEALRAARVKAEFLSNMSHEIRTPMNAIIGVCDLLWESKVKPEVRDLLKVLRNSSHVLLNLVNDVLDYSKIEAGKISVELSWINLEELIERVIYVMQPLAREKGLVIHSRYLAGTPAFVRVDPRRVEQILLNLLSNAVKFTETGEVSVETSLNRSSVSIKVSDTGVGISPEKLEGIFERFEQVEVGFTKNFSGTGLGLAIVKQLVELMNGKIMVESKKNHGSTFTFELPIGEAPDELNEREPQVASISETRGNYNFNARVLLVDDAKDNRFLVNAYLKDVSVQLIEASNGREAVEKFKNEHFDLILMDIQMPIMDGLTATKEIRRIEATQGIGPTPILALTAYVSNDEVKRTADAGCTSHLSKPIRKKELLTALSENLLR